MASNQTVKRAQIQRGRPFIRVVRASVFALCLALALGQNPAHSAKGGSKGGGSKGGGTSFACPDMPAQNPNPPAVQGTTTTVSFAAGSIIIPMDNCYQRADKPRDNYIELAVDETYGSTASMASVLCDTGSGDTGQILAYGLVHRLLQDGIPVNWSIRAGKTAWADYDFGITSGTGSPVLRSRTVK